MHMTPKRAFPILFLLFVSAVLGSLAVRPAAADGKSRPRAFVTSVADDKFTKGDTGPLAMRRIRSVGARSVQLTLQWSVAAPRPPSNPTDPSDPAYNWAFFDEQVRGAVDAGLEPTVVVLVAPPWAQRGGDTSGFTDPDPVAFGQFAQAAATRYSGSYGGLPRVASWQAWSEPNASFFFRPQFDAAGTPLSPALYRDLLRDFADGVYRARADDIVVAGNTFPLGFTGEAQAVSPLRFMRDVLCLTPKLKADANCGPPLRFDVWGHHPYTSGGPNHAASGADDVALGDLGDMRTLLDAAKREGRVVTRRGPVDMWITEFAWDSSPPDPEGVTLAELNRWVPEAMYTAWKAGVTEFTWWSLRDDDRSDSQYQSGLYFRCTGGFGCDQAKPFAESFRFPFVAHLNPARKRKRGRPKPPRTATVWGRLPTSKAGTIYIDQRQGKRWKSLAKLRADRYGVFRSGSLKLRGRGALRARIAKKGPSSRAFALKKTRDRFVKPFGS
jgi:hypothetical protein